MISDATLRRALPASTVDLLGDLIRWTLWALVFVVWVAFLQVYGRMIRLTLTDPAHSDFTIFYYTARLIADGLPMYGVSPARYGIEWAADHLGNLNPPHFQLLALPLGHLSYGHALGVWIALNLAALIASLVIIARELRIPWAWPRFWLYGAFTLSSAAFTTVAVTCELTFALMLPFTLAWRAWRNRRWVEAGAWLGACASVKLFLLLFLPWLAWRRRWDAIAAAVVSASALALPGVAVFGLGAYREWVHTLGRVGWAWLTMNASWQGFVSRLVQGAPTIAPVVSRPELVAPIALAGSVAIAAITLLSAARRERAPDATVLLILLGAILASPLGWIYYLPLAYGPILGWMGAGRNWDGVRQLDRRPLALLAVGIAFCYLPQELTHTGQPSPLASITIGSAYFWGVLAAWLGVLKAKHA
jgi:hypothetical protein